MQVPTYSCGTFSVGGDSSPIYHSGISARSSAFLSLHKTVGRTYSKVRHWLPVILQTMLSYTRAYQLNVSLKAIRNVESRCLDIKEWIIKSKLKLNGQKTELLLFGPLFRRESVPVDCLAVGEASVTFSNAVNTLGVTLDAELTFDLSVVRSCFFHVWSLRKSVHISLSKLHVQAALLVHWFCQSLTTVVIAFLLVCPNTD